EEFAAQHREAAPGAARAFWSGCDPTAPRPLGPLADLTPLADLLEPAVAVGPGSEFGRTGLDRTVAFGRIWDRLTGGGPGLLVVEDLHWADEPTLELLRFAARRIARSRLLVVGTYRDDEIGPAHPLRLLLGDLATSSAVARLPLRPLSVEAVTAL